MKMNLPNKLTVLRMFMVPFFVFFMLGSVTVEWFKWISLLLFIIASLTDLLDGKIARKYNIVTNFGKFMDPLADKLLVCSALIGLTEIGLVPAGATIIIIGREFIISGFRLIAAERGIVIAASPWGKAKTVVQMAMVIIMLFFTNNYFCGLSEQLHFDFMKLIVIGDIAIWLSVILSIISLLDYLIKNKNVMKEDNDTMNDYPSFQSDKSFTGGRGPIDD